ncbi:MAG: ribonuclease P protein component [Verrucomicrobiota bacterium]
MRLPKKRRMTVSGEFRRVRENGKSVSGKFLVLGVLKDESLESFRVGFITTKRLGNAVCRNRVRRLLRNVIVDVGERIKPGYYLVTIARKPAATASFQQLRKEWKWLGHRAKIFMKSPSEK